MTSALAWKFFAAAIAVTMVVALGLNMVPAGNARAEVCTGWSDNFNGGAQQMWRDVDGGTGSTFKFQNNRYEMQTQGSAYSKAYLASYVNSSGDDYEVQARIQRINTGDNFSVDLAVRGDELLKRFYYLGTNSGGSVLMLGKLQPGEVDVSLAENVHVSFNPGDFSLKLRVSGTSLSGKVWSGDTEPGWQISCTDTSYVSGVGGILLYKPPYAPWTTVQVAFDDVSLTCLPQRVTPTQAPPNPLIGMGAQTSYGATVTGPTTPAPPVSLPSLVIQSASLSAKSVTPGTPITVTADIANKSTVNGIKKVTLYVNGQVETTQGVTVNSGGSSQLSFNVSRSEPGDYTVYVDGVPAGSFKVELLSGNDGILIFSAVLIALAFLVGMVMLRRRQQHTG